ncbi:NUDIX hydrolase [Aurantibacillus circumpalustris]|uniref:NUDIX hydrolase n=1 Tax=Aurantibacillus circumpalustris TaxID=3036359 RepID=UPI00295AE329|nr:NUDIX domain-containing protein [Aurantibacillus circumpalustris]
MNTRIYFNDKFIELTGFNTQSSQNQSIKIDQTKEGGKDLNKLVEAFLDDSHKSSIYISHISVEKAIDILKNTFYYIEAAGGFIEKQNQFLFIRRHNRWDLPKGKLEKGETIQEAAVRECEEECGIKDLNIIKPLNSTFHIYQYKKGYALKQSYWFYMRTDFSEKLIPQLEESITEVDWFDKKTIQETLLKDTYYTIADVTREALDL